MHQPQKGDRILVRRARRTRVGTITGTVLDVRTIGGVEGILHFQDDEGRCVFLGTAEQLAPMGITQTIEPLPDTA